MATIIGFLAAFVAVAFVGGLIALAIWAKKKEKKIPWKWGVAAAIIVAVVYAFRWLAGPSEEPRHAMLLANYEFAKDINQLVVPMIVMRGKPLSREAGGWVITPPGSEYRIDYDSPVNIEYIDGKVVRRRPGEPAHDGVRPTNGIFRLYGDGYATVTIERGVYINRF